MTLTLLPPSERELDDVVTFADWVDWFGVPPERIWFNPTPGTATEKDMIYADDHLDRHCELIDATLVEKAMGTRESVVAIAIASILRTFVVSRKLGFIVGEASMFRLFPGQVRMPDVAFISLKRLSHRFPREPITGTPPELVVEVLSAGNTVKEMNRKRSEYFKSGVELLWGVDPAARSIAIYTAPETFTTVGAHDSIDGGSVLPGFNAPVREFFSDLDLGM